MKIGIIQSNPTAGALRDNAQALLDAVRLAADKGAELCVAPELALCGASAWDYLLQPDFVAACRTTLQETAAALQRMEHSPALLLGAPVANPVPQGKPLQNCAVLLRDGKLIVIGRKVLLPAEGQPDGTRYFERGVSCGMLQYKGWRFGVTIGEDAWNDRTFWQERRIFDSDPVADFMAAGGADGLINLTAVPYAVSMPSLHQRMQGWLATHYRVPVVAANLVGGNDALVYYGGSMVFDGSGALVHRAPFFEENVAVVDLAASPDICELSETCPERELWRALVVGTRDFARKCGLERAVIGLSGGIDSALVAAVAAEALGPENCAGLLMPSPYSSRGSVDDALALAENLGMRTHTVPIAPMLEAFAATFAASVPGGYTGIVEENVQARIRCSVLMGYANRYGALLLNTGNKSEAAVGYCTLYGDSAGGLAVIGDLYKRQVYALCRWYNATREQGGIPRSILDKAPSAELRPGQKDSDSLPEYDALDDVLFHYIEERYSVEDLMELGHSRELVEKIISLVHRAEFKRQQSPPALQVSGRAFSTSWRMPIAGG